VRPGTCADCGTHHEGRHCPPGVARRTAIEFPRWAAVSQCERFPDGSLTEHGRRMAAFRDSELARPEQVAPIHRTIHRGRRLAS
jgi:hypothetical protein